MASPLYFLPGRTAAELRSGKRLNRELLAAHGLADVFSDVEDIEAEGSLFELRGRGPGDHSGCLLTVFGYTTQGGRPQIAPPPVRLGYYPQFQSWSAVSPSLRGRETLQPADGPANPLWIGLDQEHPVTPQDLARKKIRRGYAVELADGNSYEVPVIRSPSGKSSLPRDLGWDGSGRHVQQIKAAYRPTWDESAAVYNLFYTDAGKSVDLDWALDLAVRALQVNYRYSRDLQNLLHLVDSENWEEVLGATVDLPLVLELAQAEKKSPDSSAPERQSTSPGPPAENHTTAPAAASCA